ncbi:MAG: nickel pincer cofactor biosynthesis protein LarB [Clostridia bacterium]|nr:nickel pincer cofactor biosynthesis protein LarB [Clostridia bacterium]
MNSETKKTLEKLKNGEITVDEALLAIKKEPFEDLGFAKIDHQRSVRQGIPEVIYGAGKTPEQIISIARSLNEKGASNVLITRLSEGDAEKVKTEIDIKYYRDARIGMLGEMPTPDGIGTILVATGGTSDIPVAEEAAVTAEALGNEVERLYDVGVSGLHRLLSHMDEVMSASVIIAVAGMEGALASVIGGLSDCPVIAVPTSVGYGASYEGISALLSMLNSCASGVTVVNIDNGFGAGYSASMINHMEVKK